MKNQFNFSRSPFRIIIMKMLIFFSYMPYFNKSLMKYSLKEHFIIYKDEK